MYSSNLFFYVWNLRDKFSPEDLNELSSYFRVIWNYKIVFSSVFYLVKNTQKLYAYPLLYGNQRLALSNGHELYYDDSIEHAVTSF